MPEAASLASFTTAFRQARLTSAITPGAVQSIRLSLGCQTSLGSLSVINC